MRRRPLVGVLRTPAVPAILAAAPALVDRLEVIPDRLRHDLGQGAGRDRFALAEEPIARLRRPLGDRPLCGHGLGLSLPSDLPIDEAMLDQVAALHRRLGFAWYSEHLSVSLTPRAEPAARMPPLLRRPRPGARGAACRARRHRCGAGRQPRGQTSAFRAASSAAFCSFVTFG